LSGGAEGCDVPSGISELVVREGQKNADTRGATLVSRLNAYKALKAVHGLNSVLICHLLLCDNQEGILRVMTPIATNTNQEQAIWKRAG
jgi:hypothetical protein